MKNIGIVTNWSERGAGYVSKQIRDSLIDQHNVFIFSRSNENSIQKFKNNKNIYLSKYGFGTREGSINKSEFKKWVLKNKIDIIIFNEQHWWTPIVWCKEWGITTGTYVDYYTAETIEFFGLYDFLICNTHRHFKTFEWHKKAFFIPWGTNIDIFKPGIKESNEIKSFFHSCGVSPERKGTDLIIKMAFENMEYLQNKAKFIIHTQVDIKEKLFWLASEIDILIKNGIVFIIEKTIPPPGLYHMGDVYIYPTVLEGIGLTIAEAKSCGLPVITTNNEPMVQFCFEEDYKIDVDTYYSREDGYFWPCSRVKLASMLEITKKVICLTKEELNQKKINSRLNAEMHLNWSKNALILSEKISIVEFTIPDFNLKNKVLFFEKSRSLSLNLLRFLKMFLYKLFLSACAFFK